MKLGAHALLVLEVVGPPLIAAATRVQVRAGMAGGGGQGAGGACAGVERLRCWCARSVPLQEACASCTPSPTQSSTDPMPRAPSHPPPSQKAVRQGVCGSTRMHAHACTCLALRKCLAPCTCKRMGQERMHVVQCVYNLMQCVYNWVQQTREPQDGALSRPHGNEGSAPEGCCYPCSSSLHSALAR